MELEVSIACKQVEGFFGILENSVSKVMPESDDIISTGDPNKNMLKFTPR